MDVGGRFYNLIKEMMRSDGKATNNEKARWEWHESADLNRSFPREAVFYFSVLSSIRLRSNFIIISLNAIRVISL